MYLHDTNEFAPNKRMDAQHRLMVKGEVLCR